MAQVAGEGSHWTGPEGTGSGLDSFDTLHSLGSLHPGPPNHQNYLNPPVPPCQTSATLSILCKRFYLNPPGLDSLGPPPGFPTYPNPPHPLRPSPADPPHPI